MKNLFVSVAMFLASVSVLASGTGTGTQTSATSGGQSGRITSTYNVGQIYVGTHLGMSIPTGIGSDANLKFNDFAKSGFVLYLDAMRLMNQNVGLGAEVGYRSNPYNDKGNYGTLTRYGTFEATYAGLDVDVTGRIFFTTNPMRPFVGAFAGGEVVMNKQEFVPDTNHKNYHSATYKTNCFSPTFGVMLGTYMKMGHQTLLSFQGRLGFVPSLKEVAYYDDPDNHTFTPAQNTHKSQTSISVTIGLHIGTSKHNNH